MRVNKPRNLRSTAKYFSLFLIAFCVLAIAAASTQAATITVNSTSDAVGMDGQCTLREAIVAAGVDQQIQDCPAGNGNDTINFDAGVFATPQTIALTGNVLNIPLANGALIINGPGRDKLTIDAGNLSGALSGVGGESLTIQGLTVTGSNGYGISTNTVGELKVVDVTVIGNAGGILVSGAGSLKVINCTVTNNVSSGDGGGISFKAQSQSVSITGSMISGNSAAGSGGGIWADPLGGLTITNSRILGNSAGADGGGIYKGGHLFVGDSTVSENSASNGGGIFSGVGYNNGAGSLTIERTTMSGNRATYYGGAIDGYGSSLTVRNSTLSGNTAYYGGGVYPQGPSLTLTASTLTANRATSTGGGIYVYYEGITLESSIIAGNFTGGGNTLNDVDNGSVTSAHNSLIGDAGSAGGVVDGVNGNIVGVDPRLGPLDYNGGPTKTHALLFNSPAINAGGPTNLTTDQRGTGFNRVVGTAADIGAFEMQPACTGVSFGANNLPVGFAAYSVVTGDFNDDGNTDFAVASLDSQNISVLIGNGDGTFASAVNFSAGAITFSVTTGDFNGDDKTDLATANLVSDNVSVLIGNGDGTFAAAVKFAVGDAPGSVTTGDFNGDGKTDLATSNANSDNISVLIGNGDGTFAAAVQFAVGDAPGSVTTGDFNGDGKTDLATSNGKSDNVSVLIGNGDGTFAAAVQIAVGDEPIDVTTGDFNGDGKTDLATANFWSNNISVLIGNGDSTFAAAVNFGAGSQPRSVTTGDFNGDGKTDLAAAYTGSPKNISVLIGNGDGTFAAAVSFPAGDVPFSVTTGDFNGDGKTDLAAANRASDNVSVLLNSCSANSAPMANGDSYSIDEDTPLSGTSVLANDTDGENDTLTAVLVNGPSNAQSFTLNPDGSFSYTPNTDFNGSDSFTYKANDGSLDSNIATVTITVNPVNDGPVVSATPDSQSVQYSDPISAVAITVMDVDSALGPQSVSTTFNIGGGAFSNGLPSGLSISLGSCVGKIGSKCLGSVSGKANVAAGTYVIRVQVSDGALSSSTDVTLVVNKEKTETVYTGDVFMFTAGPTVTTANVRLSAQLTQQADGYPGDITLAKVSFLLFKSSNLGSTPDVTVTGVAVDQSGAALKFVNLGVDTWTIKVKIDADNGYWKASPVGMGTITVEQPTNELRTSGGGWVNDAESMNGKGNFGFNVANQKKGVRGGSVYLYRGLDGFNYLVKNTSWQSGGIGFGSEGAILSKAAFSGKCVVQKIDPETGEVVDSYGNYSFTVDVRDGDLFNPRQADKYALTVLNSNGLVWRQIGSRANPPAIGGGNITVKAK